MPELSTVTDQSKSRAREDRIDAFVTRWHKAPEGKLDGPLHEEMGWSWKEYARWVETGKLPPERKGSL